MAVRILYFSEFAGRYLEHLVALVWGMDMSNLDEVRQQGSRIYEVYTPSVRNIFRMYIHYY